MNIWERSSQKILKQFLIRQLHVPSRCQVWRERKIVWSAVEFHFQFIYPHWEVKLSIVGHFESPSYKVTNITIFPSYEYNHPPIKMQIPVWGLFPFFPLNFKSQVLNVKMEQNRSEPITFQKNGRTGTKTSRKIELWFKKFIFLWSFPGFRCGPNDLSKLDGRETAVRSFWRG